MRLPEFSNGYRAVNGADLNQLLQFLISTDSGLVAYSGGGADFATPLTSAINLVSEADNDGDSVKLPISTPGLIISVFNKSSKAISVFPDDLESIDDQTFGDSFLQSADTFVQYFCLEEGKWYTNSSAGGGGGGTNLSVINRTSTTLTVASSTGSDAIIPDATSLLAGLLSASDKTKLNNAAATYTHTQSIAASQWIVNHNLGANPVIVGVFSPGGVEVQAQVTNTSPNQTVIDFVTPQTGTARCV